MYRLRVYNCSSEQILNCKSNACTYASNRILCRKYEDKLFRFKFLAEWYSMFLIDGLIFNITKIKQNPLK